MAAADNFFTKADQALKKKNFDYAIELYQQGLQIDADRMEERKRLRQAQIARIMTNGGSTTGGGLVKMKNALLLGSIKKLGMQKKYEEQIIEIEKFLCVAPQSAGELFQLAEAFLATDRMASAKQAYLEATEADPNNMDAWKNLGRLHEKDKELDEAIACWERVRVASPSDGEAGKAIRNLSAAQMMAKTEERKKEGDGSFRDLLKDSDESKKLEQAEKELHAFRVEDYARRVKEHPTDFALKFQYGELLLTDGQWDEAIAQFQNARKDPKFVTGSTYNIGKAFFNKSLHDLAIKEYGSALEGLSEPDSDLAKSVRYDLAIAHQTKGESDKALEYLEEIMSVDISFRDVSQKVTEIRSAM